MDDVEEEAHDGGDEVVMDAGAREPEETRSRSVRQSTIVRRLLPLSAPPPLQLELDELTSDVKTEITFEEVHKESSKTGNWEGYPTMNAHLHKGSLRGFRKEANYFVQEEDEKLLKYIVDKGMENYVKGKNLWLLMEREKVAENRSWQSMKERFLKSIVKRLDMFTSVGKEQKERLSKGAAAGKKRKKSANHCREVLGGDGEALTVRCASKNTTVSTLKRRPTNQETMCQIKLLLLVVNFIFKLLPLFNLSRVVISTCQAEL